MTQKISFLCILPKAHSRPCACPKAFPCSLEQNTGEHQKVQFNFNSTRIIKSLTRTRKIAWIINAMAMKSKISCVNSKEWSDDEIISDDFWKMSTKVIMKLMILRFSNNFWSLLNTSAYRFSIHQVAISSMMPSMMMHKTKAVKNTTVVLVDSNAVMFPITESAIVEN